MLFCVCIFVDFYGGVMKKIFFIISMFLVAFIAINFVITSSAEDGVEVKESVLRDKTALFVGDSITAGVYDTSENKGWAGRIAKSTGLIATNAGVPGASISNSRSDRPELGRIIDQLNRERERTFDYVIVHGGVNDAWDEVEIGKIIEGYDVSKVDITTFAGGLEETFAQAKALFPDAICGFIINFALPKCPYGNISDMSAYFDMAKKICDKWGVQYLDLYNDVDFCYNVLKVDTNTYFPDGYYCHPGAEGYDLISVKVEEWMKNLNIQSHKVDLMSSDTNGCNAIVYNSMYSIIIGLTFFSALLIKHKKKQL